ncbi:MAG: YraN family protein [Alphaproteobacteria bacterium]|jgi:putative endonuclease|nr:YraN family protein [Alphaproteobacteria bacterium]
MILTSYNKGLLAEFLASIFLVLRGYKILNKRYKTKVGEIDIVARKGNYIHFVEVKLRKNQALAKEAISYKNQVRVTNAAKIYLQKNQKYLNYNLSFDAISVNFPLRINFIKNAWGE